MHLYKQGFIIAVITITVCMTAVVSNHVLWRSKRSLIHFPLFTNPAYYLFTIVSQYPIDTVTKENHSGVTEF